MEKKIKPTMFFLLGKVISPIFFQTPPAFLFRKPIRISGKGSKHLLLFFLRKGSEFLLCTGTFSRMQFFLQFFSHSHPSILYCKTALKTALLSLFDFCIRTGNAFPFKFQNHTLINRIIKIPVICIFRPGTYGKG